MPIALMATPLFLTFAYASNSTPFTPLTVCTGALATGIVMAQLIKTHNTKVSEVIIDDAQPRNNRLIRP